MSRAGELFKTVMGRHAVEPVLLVRLLDIPVDGLSPYIGESIDLRYKIRANLSTSYPGSLPVLSGLVASINETPNEADLTAGTITGGAVRDGDAITLSQTWQNGWWERWWNRTSKNYAERVAVDSVTPTLNTSSSCIYVSGTPSGVNSDYAFARYEGRIFPQYGESYTFKVYVDDGVRVWFNNELVLDSWKNQAGTWYEWTRQCVAGEPVYVVIEYYEKTGDAHLRFRWSSASQAEEYVGAVAGTVKYCNAPEASGSWESPEYSWGTEDIENSYLTWNQEVPYGSNLSLEVNISKNGGATWEGWKPARLSGPIPSSPVYISLYFSQTRQNVEFFDENGDSAIYLGNPKLGYQSIERSMKGQVDGARIFMSNVKAEFAELARFAELNGVQVQVLRGFLDSLASEDGFQLLFAGRVTKVVISETSFDAECVSEISMEPTVPARYYWTLCPWMFKGSECGYSGAGATCDKTISTCKGYGNEANFGGFPSIPASRDVREPLSGTS